MHVYDGDPSSLSWKAGRGSSSVLVLLWRGRGYIKDTEVSAKQPPSDEEFERLLRQAKELSEKEAAQIFLMMRKKDKETGREHTEAIAEYDNGELVAFCRPPWRIGQGMD